MDRITFERVNEQDREKFLIAIALYPSTEDDIANTLKVVPKTEKQIERIIAAEETTNKYFCNNVISEDNKHFISENIVTTIADDMKYLTQNYGHCIIFNEDGVYYDLVSGLRIEEDVKITNEEPLEDYLDMDKDFSIVETGEGHYLVYLDKQAINLYLSEYKKKNV